MPTATCSGVNPSVTFTWNGVSGANQLWLDVSGSDSFAPGSFESMGPLSGTATSQASTNLKAGSVYFWRVNALTDQGWLTSKTSSFVPCAAPILLAAPITCRSATTASVEFRWAPTALSSGQQWLDLGFDDGFAPGSFVGAGPLSNTAQTYRWDNVQANVRYVYRVDVRDADGFWRSSATSEFTAACSTGGSGGDIYGSDDRLLVKRLGIDAPVNVRNVDFDGALGVPINGRDVVRYDFGYFPGFGGYPGSGGTTMIAGHVDTRAEGLAVFAPLRSVAMGDVIEYVLVNGNRVSYSVDWFEDLPPAYDWNSLAKTAKPEGIILNTCNGEFNYTTREYDHRRVVHAVRVLG